MGRLRYIVRLAVVTAIACLSLVSCDKDRRHKGEDYDKVMIMYSAGFNSLGTYLRDDIEDLKKGYLPSRHSRNALILISKLPGPGNDYSENISPYIIRMTREKAHGKSVARMDTLTSLGAGAVLADAANTRRLLEYVRDNFPSKSYGMVLSSHATGWLPVDYFSNPGKYDGGGGAWLRRGDHERGENGLHPYVERYHDPSLPAVKSVTQEVEVIGGRKYSHEMEIEEFVDAIPMHLDYLLFDACLMGGIEIAYACKDVADIVAFSQTEVLADGYDYTNIAHHLLERSVPDPSSVCSDFFEQYDKREGNNRSATISMVDCSKVEGIAQVCRTLFEKYREKIKVLKSSAVQGYFYDSSLHWHFDLYDIVAKAGADADELAELQAALDASLLYKAATPTFFNLKLLVTSGYSMYLPSAGSPYLDDFYRTLGWNKATGLVSE